MLGEKMMEHFPDPATLLEMEPEELGPFVLRYLMGPDGSGMLNSHNFGMVVPRGPLAEQFMEAWMWLERRDYLRPSRGTQGTGGSLPERVARSRRQKTIPPSAKPSCIPSMSIPYLQER